MAHVRTSSHVYKEVEEYANKLHINASRPNVLLYTFTTDKINASSKEDCKSISSSSSHVSLIKWTKL